LGKGRYKSFSAEEWSPLAILRSSDGREDVLGSTSAWSNVRIVTSLAFHQATPTPKREEVGCPCPVFESKLEVGAEKLLLKDEEISHLDCSREEGAQLFHQVALGR
tara:strand:+ start:803 stop:1120 length:318 start_codon:yes stop_codon:yes gene_type:complete